MDASGVLRWALRRACAEPGALQRRGRRAAAGDCVEETCVTCDCYRLRTVCRGAGLRGEVLACVEREWFLFLSRVVSFEISRSKHRQVIEPRL